MAVVAKQIGKPDGTEVNIERLEGGNFRVTGADGINPRLISRVTVEEAAMRVIGLPECDPVPRSTAETLAYAALGVNALPVAFDRDKDASGGMPRPEREARAEPDRDPGAAASPRDIFECAERALKLARLSETTKALADIRADALRLNGTLLSLDVSSLRKATIMLVTAIVEYTETPERAAQIWEFAVPSLAQIVRALVRWEREERRRQ